MQLDKIVRSVCNLQLERAFELLKLIDVAHERYDISRKGKAQLESIIHLNHCTNKDQKTCYSRYKNITEAPYDVLANLVFTQIDWFSIQTGFKKKLLFGFIVRKQGTSDIYVVFRGTASLGEWISNFKFIQQSYTTIRDSDVPGETHWGFRRTYERPENDKRSALWITRIFDQLFLANARPMRDFVEEALIKACPQDGSESQIFVTGHSLGGALATLATAHILKLIKDNKIFAKPPILYTFASPRVGDAEFAANFQHLECYRITNSEDIVPKVPFPTFLLIPSRVLPPTGDAAPSRNAQLSPIHWLNSGVDYQHVGLPIYFTAKKSTVSEHHTIPVYLEALTPSGD